MTWLVTRGLYFLESLKPGVTVVSWMPNYFQIFLVTVFYGVTVLGGLEVVFVYFYAMT